MDIIILLTLVITCFLIYTILYFSWLKNFTRKMLKKRREQKKKEAISLLPQRQNPTETYNVIIIAQEGVYENSGYPQIYVLGANHGSKVEIAAICDAIMIEGLNRVTATYSEYYNGFRLDINQTGYKFSIEWPVTSCHSHVKIIKE